MGLLVKKPMNLLMQEASAEGEHSLKRSLTALNLTALGIGAIIGAGIFVLTGTAAANHAGPAIVLAAGLAYFVSVAVGPVGGLRRHLVRTPHFEA